MNQMNERIDLHYQGGGSDKVYIVELKEIGSDLYVVECQFGRRGGTLNHTNKTPSPVTYLSAKRFFDRVVGEKTAKGYQVVSSSNQVSTPKTTAKPAGDSASAIDVMPQLLNPVADEDELERLLTAQAWLMQEKMDGERRPVADMGGGWFGINKKGSKVVIPDVVAIALDAQGLGSNTILDGEIIGDVYYIFDVIMANGVSMAYSPFDVRDRWIFSNIQTTQTIRRVVTWATEAEKRSYLERLRKAGAEGVVFKKRDSLYMSGRPNSGGDQLKFKFVESATVMVMKGKSTKRSVPVGAYDENRKLVGLGNVTIPANYAVPRVGAIVEVRYLYAYKGGSLYQPVYLGERSDQDAEDCTLSQLKYKKLTLEAVSNSEEEDCRWAW